VGEDVSQRPRATLEPAKIRRRKRTCRGCAPPPTTNRFLARARALRRPVRYAAAVHDVHPPGLQGQGPRGGVHADGQGPVSCAGSQSSDLTELCCTLTTSRLI